MAKPSGEKLIVDNRRARHDYHLSDRVEAGLVLSGTEVKSLRGGEATLRQAYAEVRDGEAWLVGLHVPEYSEGNRANHDPDRSRKLLLHRKEIERLASSVFPTEMKMATGIDAPLVAFARNAPTATAIHSRRPNRTSEASAMPVGGHTGVMTPCATERLSPSFAPP